MKIDKEEVEHIANLGRIKLTEEEKELFTKHLNSILEYMDTLKTLDTSEVDVTVHPVKLKMPLREDESEPSLLVNEALSNAPEKMENLFKVPKIIG